MPTYEFISCYKVWYSVKVVAADEDDAWETFHKISPRKEGVEIDADYQDVYVERP